LLEIVFVVSWKAERTVPEGKLETMVERHIPSEVSANSRVSYQMKIAHPRAIFKVILRNSLTIAVTRIIADSDSQKVKADFHSSPKQPPKEDPRQGFRSKQFVFSPLPGAEGEKEWNAYCGSPAGSHLLHRIAQKGNEP